MRSHPATVEPLEARIAPATVYAITSADQLIAFDAYDPDTILSTIPIDLPGAETILGIDFRPADGALFALSSGSKIYTLNLSTGAATQVGSGSFSVPLNGTTFAFDFNPSADRIRILSNTEQNMRINPNTGAVVDSDPTTAGIQIDGTPGGSPELLGMAYSNNVAGTSFTTAYIIDTVSDELKTLGSIGSAPESPNGGVVFSYDYDLGVNATGNVNFDIGRVFGFETALASLQVNGVTSLYNINLTNGHADLIGPIGTGFTALKGLSISPTETTGAVTLTGNRTATYTDTDGDVVTVTITKGTLSQAMFSLRKEGPNNGAILQKLDLTIDPETFGSNVTISAKRSDFGGDGQVNVGFINATGLDLGVVKVSGDLGRIDAGGGTDNKKSITSLDVLSLGAVGTSTQSITVAANADVLQSDLLGGVSKINVRGSIVGATVSVTGGLDAKIGTVTILGNLIGGPTLFSGAVIAADSDIASIKVSGSVLGGDGIGSGYVFAARTLKTLNVLGSLIGGNGAYSGTFEGATVKTATVGGDLRGGDGTYSGSLSYYWMSGKITVKGSLFGGPLEGSGSILAVKDPAPDFDDQIDGTIGTVTVAGGLHGGAGKFSGAIRGQTLIKSATVSGSLYGSTGEKSGSIYSDQTLTYAKVRGNATGGAGLLSGSIAGENADDGGAITKSITVLGSLFATATNNITGIVLQGKTGNVTIGGSVVGLEGSTVTMRFTGYPFLSPAPKNSADANAVGAIKITGDFRNAEIITGFDGQGPTRGDANIGSITIGGSMQASNIVAAIDPGSDGIWGNDDDSLISRRGSGLVPTIGAITIKGQLIGSPGGSDGFVITAAVIKSLKVGVTKIPLSSSVVDLISQYGPTRDITIREESEAV